MVVYQDIISGDNLLSDEFPHTEIFDGLIWDVEGKWVVRALDSAEGGDEDEGVDDQAEKIVDIVKTFKLQEVLPPFDKQQFVSYMKNYLKQITPKLDEEKLVIFKKNMTAAGDYLLGKLSDLQFFTGESMDIQGAMVFAYYKDGAAVPTFLYLSAGLKEV